MGDSMIESGSRSPTKEYLSTALQSLDSLSEQVLQFIFNTSLGGNKLKSDEIGSPILDGDTLLPQQRDALNASLSLMRGLLMDAQLKFKKIVDKNQRLASHIDGTIQSANQEVNTLRLELNMTNQKLRELTIARDVCSHCQESKEMGKLLEENTCLAAQNRQLLKELENMKDQITGSDSRNKEVVEALERERRRLKRDKADLLTQIDEMQRTVDDKEEQLRDFIRDFELQMIENEDMLKEADEERKRLLRERNDYCRRQQELADVVSSQRIELVSNERKIKELEAELTMIRQNSVQVQSSKRRSMHISADETLAVHKPTTPCGDELSISTVLLDPSPSPPSSRHCLVIAATGHSSSSEDVQVDPAASNAASLGPSYAKKKKFVQQLSGSLSRAFKLGRNRKSLDITRPDATRLVPRNDSFSVSSLSSDADVFLTSSRVNLFEHSEEEKKRILDENWSVSMDKWKADAVLIWLEMVMKMEQYLQICAENIKSGKVLLGLTEADLESYLNIENALHRRKLFLAIEEFRNPSVTIATMTPAGQLDHWWVCEQWLIDIGLTQYASRFREHLIDGRTLTSLTRRDLERHLGMEGKKLQQEGVMRGVQLLRMLGFNIQRLDERRQMCQVCDADLLVWSNNRLIQWTKSIDLKEYSSNLRDSGVHGAMLVLDSQFTSDDMAAAMGIPVNKATVRRHLASELDSIVGPARESLDEEMICELQESSNKKSSHFNRVSSQRSRRSIRSSISRGLSRQLSKDNQLNVK